jgi:hypothetical protein
MVWRYLVLLFLIPCIYAVFGWCISHEILSWSRWLIERGEDMNLTLNLQRIDLGIYGLAALLITSIALGLTLLSEKVSILFSSWFKSDTSAILSILGWSLAVVFILYWRGEFVRLLILVSATILGRLELQEAGYNRLQIFWFLALLCLGSFALGVWAHSIWGNMLHRETASLAYF